MSRIRPARPLAPTLVAIAVIGTWWLVAHNSGAGWVQTIGDVVFGTLAVGIAGPAVILSRARVRLAAAPADGTAGLPAVIAVDSSTRVRVRPAGPPGPEAFAGPRRGGADRDVVLLPDRRGVHAAVVVDVATAAPFGLQWWTRRVVLELPAPLHVAPRRGEPDLRPPAAGGDEGDRRPRPAPAAGEARGARPYSPGDSRRRVHWPATAHSGELMIRELEEPAARPVTVTVDLPADADEAERLAGRALGTVLLLLDRGTPVVLATTEEAGPVSAPVADRLAAGRRLARAVPG